MRGISSLTKELLAFQKGLCSIDFVIMPQSVFRHVHSFFQTKVFHRVRSSASSCSFHYPLVFLRLFSSCLRLLPHLHLTSINPSTFPSITCFRRQFLRKMWPNQLVSLLLLVCGVFLFSLTLRNIFSSVRLSIELVVIKYGASNLVIFLSSILLLFCQQVTVPSTRTVEISSGFVAFHSVICWAFSHHLIPLLHVCASLLSVARRNQICFLL